MPPTSRTTRQVAADLGVPYTTLTKWVAVDALLAPIAGPGGRRGGDRWSPREIELARLIVRLRAADLPVRIIAAIVGVLRASKTAPWGATVHVAVHARDTADSPERRLALLELRDDGSLRDAAQLGLAL